MSPIVTGDRYTLHDSPRLERVATWGVHGLVNSAPDAALVVAGSRLLLVHSMYHQHTPDFTIQRLTNAGQPDTTFGANGTLTVTLPSPGDGWHVESVEHACTAKVVGDDLVVTAAVSWRRPGSVARKELVALHASAESMRNAHPTFTPAIVAGTATCIHSSWDPTGPSVWQYDSGKLHLYAGTDGIDVGPTHDGMELPFGAPGLAAFGGKVFVLGRDSNRPDASGLTLMRLDGAGRPDPTFGEGGTMTITTAVGARAYATAFHATSSSIDLALIDPEAGIVELHRLDAEGRATADFGQDGRITLRNPKPPEALRYGYSVSFDAHERAYVALGVDSMPQQDIVRRYATDSADLTVTMRAAGTAGAWRRVQVTTTNRGPRGSGAAVTKIVVPRGYAIRAATTTIGHCRTATSRAGTEIRCTAPTLLVGEAITTTFQTHRPTRASPSQITATVSARNRRDVRPRSNTASLRI